MKLPFNSDTHIHTNLSSCAPRDTLPGSYKDEAGKAWTQLIGFSNHMWDKEALAPAPWYTTQDVFHVLEIKNQLADMPKSITVKIGCECEFPGRLALSEKNAQYFDYMLITASHFHIKGVCTDFIPQNPSDARKLLIERFALAAKADTFGTPAIICHPFFPLGWNKERDEIVGGITDDEFCRLLTLAKENGKGIEIHHASITSGTPDTDGFSYQAMRYLSIAKKVGCRFSFGSDLHKPESFAKKQEDMHKAAKILGITKDDMFDIK